MSKTTAITRLAIHNFKGVANLQVDFHPDRPTAISGRNGTGKTTIADAYTWLLWGLNSEEQQTSKFGINPNDASGKPRLDLNPEVEGCFTITDNDTGEVTELRLRRCWTSMWRTRSGEVEREFVRNKGEYFVDDIPVKEAEYAAAVEGIIPPEIFKCVTNPYYFPRLHWKDKREILLRMAGDVTLEDVASRAPEFEALLAEISGKTLDEYVKKYSTQIAKINAELAQIQVRIQEAERATPPTPDHAALEGEKAALEARAAELEAAMASTREAEQAQTMREAQAYAAIRQKRAEQERVVREAAQAEEARAAAANAGRSEILAQLQQARNSAADRVAEIDSRGYALRKRADALREEIADMESRQARLREQWYEENARQFSTGAVLTCPITGGDCHDPQACAAYAQSWQAAQEAFIQTQTQKKDAISDKGKKLGAEIAAKKAEMTEAEKELQDLREARTRTARANDLTISELTAKLAAAAAVTPESVDPQTLPRWAELQQEIERMQGQVSLTTAPAGGAELMAELKDINKRIMEINAQLGARAVIEQQAKRIAELQEAERALLQERASAQRMLAIADRLTREHMTAVEERVNKLFTLVRFQMVEPTATTGELKPGCACWVGGVKYGDKNRAGKVNAGLDIINAFCRYHGVRAPIFIDNAEAVNQFIPTESQLVLLNVSTGDLTIE